MRRPWIGNQFEARGFLIVGESHYWDEAGAEDPELTNDAVGSVVSGKRLRFFTSVERAVTGCGPGETQPSTFWHGVAFANFCPEATPASDKRPTPDMWTRGVEEFPRLLSQVRPGHVLFVTKGGWDRTEQTDEAEIEWKHGDPILTDGAEHPTGFFATKDTSARAYSTYI